MDDIILTKKEEALLLLDMIDVSLLDYSEWVNVGMALDWAGHDCSEWSRWSAQDSSKFVAGECEKKWRTFKNSGSGSVTVSTLAMLAKNQGHSVSLGSSSDSNEWIANDGDEDMEMDSVIGGGKNNGPIIDKNWIRATDIPKCPDNWKPNDDLINYLLTLFQPEEYIAYTMESFTPEHDPEKRLPTKGIWGRKRDEIINMLKGTDAPISDYDRAVGAWIRVNPFDGNGVNDANVADHRYVLIESDDISLEKQYTILKELELPIATLVHSGKKSLHALVKIEAPNYQEYRKRVDFLWDFCKKNSFTIDTQNRNPSRLSRMPGIMRDGQPQYLIDTHIGKKSWNEWFEYIQDMNDDLPEMESLADTWDEQPPLAPELIFGVLRRGHKMLIAGPSKAGKSWNLIQLSIALAEGGWWNGWQCDQGKVLYVNLELDRASCLNRFKTVYDALGIENPNIQNIDIWNLRGKSAPMDKLAPKLIRRALKKRYSAIIIDPIYKVITGDENSADQMAHFCNQFDKICTELEAAVIYCHHHSKGSQGDKKSADRSSGSGVFARDPDALIDLLPLEIDDSVRDSIENVVTCRAIRNYMNSLYPNWSQGLTGDETLVASFMRMEAERTLKDSPERFGLPDAINKMMKVAENITTWRIEGTLREFANFKPRNMFFEYPTHRIDQDGLLDNACAEGSKIFKKTSPEEKKQKDQERAETKKQRIEDRAEVKRLKEIEKKKEKDIREAERLELKRIRDEEKEQKKEESIKERYDDLTDSFKRCYSPVTVATIAEEVGVSTKTIRRQIKYHPNLIIENSIVKELDE